MCFVYNQCFNKLFKTFDKDIIRSCQFFMGILPFDLLLDSRRLNFLGNASNAVSFDIDKMGIERISHRYRLLHVNDKFSNWKGTIWRFFQTEMDNTNVGIS